jgi:hypothetical protein
LLRCAFSTCWIALTFLAHLMNFLHSSSHWKDFSLKCW